MSSILFAISGNAFASGLNFDFGPGREASGYSRLTVNSQFTSASQVGWVDGGDINQRDRKSTDSLLRDFVMGSTTATLRVMLEPGNYMATAIMGDAEFGNHVLKIDDGLKADLPLLKAQTGESSTLVWSLHVKASAEFIPVAVDLSFSSPVNNWVINGLSIKQEKGNERPELTRKRFAPSSPRPVNASSQWADVAGWDDPTEPLLKTFLKNQSSKTIEPTGLDSIDYIRLAADNVDFWKQHQNADGAIIDPYRHEEWQYSTPCFALAAAASIEYLHRDDLLEPAMKAMDWACQTLSDGRAANHHEDFFAPVLAHALPLLKKHVPADRVVKWEDDIRKFDPYDVYRAKPGANNWNVVALCGEYLFHKLGLRDSTGFIMDSLNGQGRSFGSPFGLYLEGPMAYDHFPRLWAGDMVAHGYDGANGDALAEVLRRAAITSMFMQSPTGELPLGHRSAHHQWNEAEQCVTYEIYAAQAAVQNKPELAGAFKRAAHLALASIKRWQRPTGELWIVKNKVDPAEFHGFEGYSGHSQYNLLPMAMLVMAHEHALKTESVEELPAPADVGGFVLHIEKLHKIFANADGAYVELETGADRHYDTSGFVRVHFSGENPQIGPSDILTTKSNYTLPEVDRVNAAIGPVWKTADGKWRSLAEMGGGDVTSVTLLKVIETPEHVKFRVEYHGKFDGPESIVQTFDITGRKVRFTTELSGYHGPSRLEWPVFDNNGTDQAGVKVSEKSVTVALGNSTEKFVVPRAASVSAPEKVYPNRNGWARLGRAEFPEGGPMTMEIGPTD